VSKIQPLEYRWCIDCQKEVILDLERCNGQDTHTFIVYPETSRYAAEYMTCFGPFASCPPPDVPEEFDLMDEPSPDELAEMNLNAEILLSQLEG
jgi:hypothetical protein